MKGGIVYYTCLTHKPGIEKVCRQQLDEARGSLELVSVSLNQAIEFGNRNIVCHGERGPLMMHRQVLAGLVASTADFVFLCESDVLYHPSHFEFTPKRADTYYYNTNVWKARYPDGLCVWTDDLQQVSGLCAYRTLLVEFYRQRILQIELEGFNRHYEPGVKQMVGGKRAENWRSLFPNVCIRHDANLTKSKWSPSEFRNPRYARGWQESHEVVGWGSVAALIGSQGG